MVKKVTTALVSFPGSHGRQVPQMNLCDGVRSRCQEKPLERKSGDAVLARWLEETPSCLSHFFMNILTENSKTEVCCPNLLVEEKSIYLR